MKLVLLRALLLCFPCFPAVLLAASSSKGKDSTVVVGTLISVSGDGKMFTVLQEGKFERVLILADEKALEYVGFPEEKARTPLAGYGVVAKVTVDGGGGKIDRLRLTEPLTAVRPLGPERVSMTEAQIHAASDEDRDGRLSYTEFSASIYRSEKHGPDKFVKADRNGDGWLSVEELAVHLPEVAWWAFSRKTTDQWFATADSNNDGIIDAREFVVLADAKGHVEGLFQRADLDANGTLDKPEVAAHLERILNILGSGSGSGE